GLFRVGEDLRAEAAPDVRRDHPDLGFREIEHEGAEDQPEQVRILAGGVDRVAVGTGIVFTDGRTGFHGVGHEAVVYQLELDDMGGLDRKSTRLNSSHVKISYAVFCLKKKIEVAQEE